MFGANNFLFFFSFSPTITLNYYAAATCCLSINSFQHFDLICKMWWIPSVCTQFSLFKLKRLTVLLKKRLVLCLVISLVFECGRFAAKQNITYTTHTNIENEREYFSYRKSLVRSLSFVHFSSIFFRFEIWFELLIECISEIHNLSFETKVSDVNYWVLGSSCIGNSAHMKHTPMNMSILKMDTFFYV